MSAADAVALLGVKRATLYTYASRGWVRTQKDGGRAKRYHRADLERLAARAAATAGHGPRAASALDWGEPVLTTQISGIDADGPYYRGVPALDLLDWPLERIAEHMWDIDASPWPSVASTDAADSLLALRRRVDGLAAEDAERHVQTGPLELRRAKRIVRVLRDAAGVPGHPDITAALALTVDHGLNASTFAARVVASTGADLYACVTAGLAALSGPRHGTASLRVHRLLRQFRIAGRAAVIEVAAEGGLPGFEHPLYPAGDPRADVLLQRTADSRAVQPLRDLVELGTELGVRPNLDVGLLAVCLAHGLEPSAASRLFAAARSVGWIAHVFEQRASPGLLRPRASYGAWEPVGS